MATDFDLIAEFVAVCEHGSFTLAAEHLSMTKSVLSEHISRLEKNLGVQLLRRTTRKLSPTSEGVALLESARLSFDQLHATINGLQKHHATLSGNIRIAAPFNYSTLKLAKDLAQFAQLYPEVAIELFSSDEFADFVGQRIDVGIRIGWITQSNLKARRICEFQQILVASPEYIQRCGLLTVPSELVSHEWIALSVLTHPHQWVFCKGEKTEHVNTKGRLSANTVGVVHAWVLKGMGLSVLPNFVVDEHLQSGRLVHVLPQWELPLGGIFATHLNTPHLPQRVSALIDFLTRANKN